MVGHLLSRNAEEEEEGAGHVGGLRAWRGEPSRLEATRRQPHLGAPVGAGENGAAARGESSKANVDGPFSCKRCLCLTLAAPLRPRPGGEDPSPPATKGEGWRCGPRRTRCRHHQVPGRAAVAQHELRHAVHLHLHLLTDLQHHL